MSPIPKSERFDLLQQLAISVHDLTEALDWYTTRFRCRVKSKDTNWAVLSFANVELVLVLAGQAYPMLTFSSPEAGLYGGLRLHSDGTQSVSVPDADGHAVEIFLEESAARVPE